MQTRAFIKFFCAIIVASCTAYTADDLISFPLVFPRGEAMGGTGMSYGGSEEAVYRNPAWAGSFRRLCVTVPGISIDIDNNYFSLMQYMAEHKDEFGDSSAAESAGAQTGAQNAFFADTLLRQFDSRWFGFSANIIDFSIFIRGFGLLLRSRYSADFSANRGLLFPFMLAEYGQERELSLVYGRKFARDHIQIGLGLNLLQQQKKIVSVASKDIGTIGPEFWSLEDTEWQRGLGLDIGFVGNIPGRRHVAASVSNIGLKTREQDVPEISFGYSRELREVPYDEYHFIGNITGAAEYLNVLGDAHPLARLKLGGEMTFNILPREWLGFHLRTGLNGGYLTFGIGARALKFITVDYVTYAEEIGSYVGQEMRRKHFLYGKVQFDFNKKKKADKKEEEAGAEEADESAEEEGSEEEQQELEQEQ
jgi:hypothetical protein